MTDQIGEQMYQWVKELFPINRSITGDGVRETLKYIQRILPDLKIQEVASGTSAFDWIVPDEWSIEDGYIETEQGERVVDYKENNLHVVGYSQPIDAWVSLNELEKHLHYLPEKPDAIPYVTSYYKPYWGFCLSANKRKQLGPGRYHVCIDSELKPGFLNYGELMIEGEKKEEIFLSTYVCHPSMANNELSGPVVTSALAAHLQSREELRYSYRIIFVPETIGAIVYLSQNLRDMKKAIVAGYQVTCVGDDRQYSFVPSRRGGTLADRAALHALKHVAKKFVRYSFLDRGSDEREYCSPGVDLPVASIMRSKYGCYPEYHTSLDQLDSVVTADGLAGGYSVIRSAIEAIELDCFPRLTTICEPNLGKYGIYPEFTTDKSYEEIRKIKDLLALSDGETSLLEIAELIGVPIWELSGICRNLIGKELIEVKR